MSRSEMQDPQQQTKRPKRKDAIRFLVAVLGVVALLIVAAVMSHLPPRLSPEQVVNQLGTYRFPTGNSKLHITKDESGNVKITVRHHTTRFYFIPHSYADPISTFESEREWFVSVDKYQRLWVFHGHWDRSWGELRQMPSGGTIPYAPAVHLSGLLFTPDGFLYPLVEQCLKPGGIILFEAYSKSQLSRNTGGPSHDQLVVLRAKYGVRYE